MRIKIDRLTSVRRCDRLKERKCPNSFGRLHVYFAKSRQTWVRIILAALFFYSLSFFFRKESKVITVLVMVAIQVTNAITNSKVITSLPSLYFSTKLIELGSRERRLKAEKLRVTQQF